MLEYFTIITLAVVECTIYVWMLKQLLERRFFTPLPVIFVCSFILQFSRHLLPENVLMRCGMEILADLLLCCCFFKGKVWRNVIYPIIFFDLLFVCDSSTVLFFSLLKFWKLEAITENGIMQIIMSLISRVPLPFFVRGLVRMWEKTDDLRSVLYPVPIAFFVAQLAFYPYEFSFYYSNSELMFFLYFFFGAISICFLIFIASLLSKRKASETKLRIMEVQYREQLNYVREIQETYKGLTAHIHDTRHHLDLINSYILRSEYEAAQAYISSLYGTIGKAYINYTGNADVDSVIFSKHMLCNDKGISVAAKGALPHEINWLDTADICVLLANGLQNAIEACVDLEGAIIEIELKYDENWLLVTINNPYKETPLRIKDSFVSSKGAGHGNGIESMTKIAQKYEGYLRLDTKENQFSLDILLQNNLKTTRDTQSRRKDGKKRDN